MRILYCLVFVSTAFVFGCGAGLGALKGPMADQMLRVEGNQIVDGTGKTAWLKGVAFGNQVWLHVARPETHHNEKDYERVAAMGMNTVRFYMNYITFEDDDAPGQYKEAGWAWLDQNVAWAKKHNIYLVLNMHVPQGGFQSNNQGKALWNNRADQERLINLWKAIAERYRNEPIIAGYDFLNEPVVSKSHEQWHTLAAELVEEVRKVDPYHIFFIERVNAIDGEWKENEERNFFLVDDPNVVYEFHFYKPFHFTHQNVPWVEFVAKETRWPDPDRVGIEWFLVHQKNATEKNPKLKPGTTDWSFYEGVHFKIEDPEIALGRPVMACQNNSGLARFDDLVIEELAPDGTATEMWTHNPTTDRGWYFHDPSGRGNYGIDRSGHNDATSLKMERINGEAKLSADIYMFKTKQGAAYRISGWMKGEDIPGDATCEFRIEFLKADVPIHAWDKGFLEQELNAYLAFGKKHNVPLFLGEWGTYVDSFQGNRGGVQWVSDMLDIILKNNLHFTYHDYHESSFGIYGGDSTLPSDAISNKPLIELFRQKLGATGTAGTAGNSN